MRTPSLILIPHERGAAVDLEMRELDAMDRLKLLWGAVCWVVVGRANLHLTHATIQERGMPRVRER